MARMRMAKQCLRQYLEKPDWRIHLDEIAHGGMAHVGPLFSLLLLSPRTMHRAAVALGKTCAHMSQNAPDAARNIIRRFMWHLNEESGNMGWGIPEAFAESLAASPPLARSFHKVLISYVIDLGRDDNYCDNSILRRSCYWGIGRLLQAHPALEGAARPWLKRGLDDTDMPCRGMAAWALGQLPADMTEAPALRHLAKTGCNDPCVLFDGNDVYEKSVSRIARETLLCWRIDA